MRVRAHTVLADNIMTAKDEINVPIALSAFRDNYIMIHVCCIYIVYNI